MRALLVSLLVAAFAFPLAAATVFDFVCKTMSSAPYEFSGHASIAGDRVRYDVTDGNHPVFNPRVTIITKDRGETLIIIDHRQRTWFMRKTLYMSGPLSTWKAPGQTGATKPQVVVTKEEDPPETIAGVPTTKYTLDANYGVNMNVEGEKLKATVRTAATLWMMEGKSDAIPFGFHFALKPGFGNSDDRIAKALRGKGIPLRAVIDVTRTITDGQPVTERFELTVDKVHDEKVADGQFVAPPGYQYREPTFGYAQ